MFDRTFWRGRRVFLTGHTGFKGSWMCLWLRALGAEVTGYALKPPTIPSLYELARVDELVKSVIADVRDAEALRDAVRAARPEVAIHMAAQPLVRESYDAPAETFAVNLMGTVNFLEAVRACPGVKVAINVTTDKVYENRETGQAYREDEPLGGYDPYSASKACSELATASFRNSFFNPAKYASHGVALATARAGNVIGGGDWAADRLVPDCVRSMEAGKPVRVRNPRSVRPWQHVLEPLGAYLRLAERLAKDGPAFAEAWNFGPDEADAKPVEWVVKELCRRWGAGASYEIDKGEHPHEAGYLRLDCGKAKARLGWKPRWDLSAALDRIVEWTKAHRDGRDLRAASLAQTEAYEGALAKA